MVERSEQVELYSLLQEMYFDNIDAGDAASAVASMHEDVNWVHTQVWEHDGHGSHYTDELDGREAVREFLAGRIDEMQAEGIEHKIRETVHEGDRGAFRAEVVGPDGERLPFIGWVELTDGKVSRYLVAPERVPE